MASVLITGANREIGLGLVKLMLKPNGPFKVVIATYRNADTATSLMELTKKHSNLHVLKLDVANIDSFENFVKEVEGIVGENGLNVLINDAGVIGEDKEVSFSSVTSKFYMDVFKTNFFGPAFLCQALLPLILTAAKKNSSKSPGISRAAIFNVTSLLGSIADNVGGGYWAYRESMSALNQFSRSLAKELASHKVVDTVLHPGHVKMTTGEPTGKLTVEESVSGLYKLMLSADESKSDKFYQWDGKELPW